MQLVELAPLTVGSLVPVTVAQALGLADAVGATPTDGLVEALADRRVLLVVDNCEHLIVDVAALVVALLERCGGLSVLATSRQRLDVPGEALFPVQPLALPDGPSAPLASIATSEAVMLFVERAGAAEPSFELTDANAAAVAQICAHLDGIPLAIELAAARSATLAPAEIAARLDDRFGLLAGGRSAPARHQTLRALVRWSYDLLDDDAARRLLGRLAVFHDGFDLEAAEVVAGGWAPLAPEATVVALAGLVERSLVQVERRPVTRYALLETIRAFAAERLVEAGRGSRRPAPPTSTGRSASPGRPRPS